MKCQNKECLHYSEDFVQNCSRLSLVKLTDCPDYMDTKKKPEFKIKASAWYLAKPVSIGKGELIGSFRTKREASRYKIECQLMDCVAVKGMDSTDYGGIKWEIKPKLYLHSLQTVIDGLNELTSKN